MGNRKRVLICGGGIAGPVLALFLRNAEIECCVFEASDGEQGGGGLGLAPNGMRVLRALGMERRVREASVETTNFVFWNDRGKRLSDVPMWSESRCGVAGVTIARAELQRLLVDEMRRVGVEYVTGRRLIKIDDDGSDRLGAHFSDRGCCEGDLLVGADGIRSTVRRLAMPEAPAPVYTGLAGLGGFSRLSPSRELGPESNTAMNMVMGRNGFVGYADMITAEGPRTMWWNTAEEPLPDRAEEARRTREQWLGELLQRHRDWAEPVPGLMSRTEHLLHTAIHDVPNLERWSAGRVMLIGDAAHAVAPHSGQGASMAMEDGMMLARLLRDGDWSSLGSTLRAFEEARRPRTGRVVALGRKNGGRKREMPAAAYWVLQQFLRFGMPLVLKRQDWLLRYEVGW